MCFYDIMKKTVVKLCKYRLKSRLKHLLVQGLKQLGAERMFWKMTNLQLKKGYIFLLYGDSVPIFGKICERNG